MLFKNISLLDENFQLVENTDLLTEGAFIKKSAGIFTARAKRLKTAKTSF